MADANGRTSENGHSANDFHEKEPLELDSEAQLDASKEENIRNACQSLDVDALILFAASKGGFLNDQLRKLAWPILLGSTNDTGNEEWKHLPTHREEEQVALDVNRSFVYYPNDPNAEPLLKDQLSNLIISLLRTHPSLAYFQGFHDVAQVLLLVLGPAAAQIALARMSLLRIRDFMLPTLAGAMSQLNLLPAILKLADPPLANYLPTNSFWALSAILTLYAHDVQNYAQIARLFDFLLVAPATAPLYFFAAVIISRREDLLEIDPEDIDILHVTLTRLPSNRMDFDKLITDALLIMKEYPPRSLGRAWRSISVASVLRTATDPQEIRSQTLADGEKWLAYQTREAARQTRFQAILRSTKTISWNYRRPALAIAVAAFAIWLGKGDYLAVQRFWFKTSLMNLWKTLARN